jgi:hypothetical protein
LSDEALSERESLSQHEVESHVAEIFTKLGLVGGPGEHRRVLAALTYLRG